MGKVRRSEASPLPTTPGRARIMRAIKSRNTKPELVLRRALHARGFRYRLHVAALPGRPDIVFPKYQAVVEVRGCFWHGHSCLDGRKPLRNAEYWVPKLARNKERDSQNLRLLRRLGYRVKVVWECQLCEEQKVISIVRDLTQWLKNRR